MQTSRLERVGPVAGIVAVLLTVVAVLMTGSDMPDFIDDAETIAQLNALRSGDFTQFAVDGGFTTPPARKRLRFSRRVTD